MPAARSTPSRQRGTPKAKGAVRAKSGCYTCRIRRKKCDENKLDDGRCQTCARLRLECLGFGQKRPEWLRETRNVKDVREKIKTFLASHGMIKGHTGSVLPRDSEYELPTLRLSEDSSESSQSPSTPTLSLSNDPAAPWNNQPAYSGDLDIFTTRSDSPYSEESVTHDQTFLSTIYVPSPAIQSTFSTLYHADFPPEDWNMSFSPQFPRNPQDWIERDRIMDHYIRNIIHLQYILVDGEVPVIITQTSSSNRAALQAVGLLASVHIHRFRQPDRPAFEDVEVRGRLQSVDKMLSSSATGPGPEDAMAALHVVSSILFDGGQGSWKRYLTMANHYVDGLFRCYGSPVRALRECSAKDAFIIKTAIWFDTLASVTTQEVPHFLEDIRALFGPTHHQYYPQDYSMISPMGCENIVVWALAETSALAHWRNVQEDADSLSIFELVKRAKDIDDMVHHAHSLNGPAQSGVHFANDDLRQRREIVSQIFRSAARLYLQSVVAGDHPQVPEIKKSVSEVVQCIRQVEDSYSNHPRGQTTVLGSIVRSTVFAFFLCGALTDDRQNQSILLEHLAPEGAGAGNCGSVRNLLEYLWSCRQPGQAVPWRRCLKATETLLV